MAAGSSKEEDLWVSVMEAHPEHVKAIGMISIENANLEDAMSILFARVIFVNERIAYAIYMTPKSAAARIDLLENGARAALAAKKMGAPREPQKEQAWRKIANIVKRARTVTGKRHAIIHDGWGVQDGDVTRYVTGSRELKSEPMPLTRLRDLVSQFRILVTDVLELAAEFKNSPPKLASMKL